MPETKPSLCARRTILALTSLAITAAPVRAMAQPGPTAPCDVDADGDVDGNDVSVFVLCHTGPLAVHDGTAGCVLSDSNRDGHVDALDVRSLQNCFSGADHAADGSCAVQPLAAALTLPCPGGSPPDPSQAPGQDLHKVTIHASDAICNDGSPGIFYIRRAATADQLNRWVLHIEAGGSCEDVVSCRERWCGSGPVYTAAKMSSAWAYEAITGRGIFNRPDSPLGSANQVFFYYCSSDTWSGQRSNAVITADADPSRGFSIHFRGHRILEAALDMLTSGPVTSDSGLMTVPSLANAVQVLVTGSSAGSNAARHHLDWIASRFDPTQTAVRGVFDTGFTPPSEMFGDPAVAQLIDDSALAKAQTEAALYRPFRDESCQRMLGDSPDWWRCAGSTYTTLNHITTPFFQRMDLTDSNPVGAFAQSFGVSVDDFATTTIAALARLPEIGTNAAEADQIDFVPGVYGPNCGQHVALTNNDYFLVSTVEDAGSVPRTFDAALRAWLLGAGVFIVDEHPSRSSICP